MSWYLTPYDTLFAGVVFITLEIVPCILYMVFMVSCISSVVSGTEYLTLAIVPVISGMVSGTKYPVH